MGEAPGEVDASGRLVEVVVATLETEPFGRRWKWKVEIEETEVEEEEREEVGWQ